MKSVVRSQLIYAEKRDGILVAEDVRGLVEGLMQVLVDEGIDPATISHSTCHRSPHVVVTVGGVRK